VLTAQNSAAIVQIVRRLDGIPLATELAAARVKVLAVERIASRLDDRFRLLTGGSRTALPRQQTLRATIDWSYDLLSVPERQLLQRLTVFAGGSTLEATEAVGAGEGIDEYDVLDLLTRLVDRSMVLVDKHEGGERYVLLETIRQYAGERLIQTGQAATLRDRHRDWYLRLAERAEPEMRGPRQREWLDYLEADQDNLRLALAWCLERGDSELGLRLTAALWVFWLVRGQGIEARDWSDRILRAPGADTPSSARAKTLLAKRLFDQRLGDQVAARRVVEESLALYRQLGDRHGIPLALRELAHQAMVEGEPARAEPLLAEALTLANATGDSWMVAQVQEVLGQLAEDRADHQLARQLYSESLASFRAMGDQRAIGHMLWLLGVLVAPLGEVVPARRHLEEAVAIFRELRATTRLSFVLTTLAMVELAALNRDRSRGLLEESLSLARQSGYDALAVYALLGLWSLDRTEDGARAQAHLAEALALATQNSDSELTARALGWCGAEAIGVGKVRRGTRLLAAANRGVRSRAGSSFSPLITLIEGWLETSRGLARATLGEEVFAAMWAEGQAMTPEQAVAYALDEDTDA
jgi:non-specific serine/threonine protein kinase